MKRMLFNATHAEETRVGIVDGQKLIDIDIETVGREARKSNIYKGVVTRIEPSLEACFVNYGEERHGFLPFKEISRAYFKEGLDVRTCSIRDAITEGQELIVQVEKEERGNKGAALTTFISLAGRYLVLMPNNPRGGGVSRRIEGEERQELREAMEKLDLPHGMSTIARTAGIGRTTEELQWDLNYLLKLWEAISDAATPQYELTREENGRRTTTLVKTAIAEGRPLRRVNPPPFLIVEESNLVVRAIRDYFQPDIGEVLVDTDEIYEQARQFMAHVMPDMVNRVKRYREDIPLFTRFQIEHQIETAYSRTVPLPSGGAIVIDHTEALVAVDVNSARATRGADIEETAFRTNCEAADEVARQMRLRDLGGLIVIDFIDMADTKNQRAVEQRLKDALRYDRARVQMAKISRFGLMELSRQRLRPALSEGSHVTCPRCNGVGVIRDTESCALQVLRILQEEAMKEGTGAVHAQVPVDVATFLLNEKRNDITKLEARHRVPIVLIPNTHLETPHYHIERLRQDDERLEDATPSFNRAEDVTTVADDPYALKSQEDKPQRPKQVPVIKNVLPRDPAPVHPTVAKEEKDETNKSLPLQPVTPQKGLFSRIISFFFGDKDEKPAEKKEEEKKPAETKDKGHGREDRRRGRRNNRHDTTRTRRVNERPEQAEKTEERAEEKKRRERPARRPVEAPETAETTAQKADNADRTTRRRSRRRRPTDETQVNTPDTAVTTEVNQTPEAEVPTQEVKAPVKADVEEVVTTVTEDVVAEAQRPEGEEATEETQGETRRRRPRRRRRSKTGADQAADAATTEVVATDNNASTVVEAEDVKVEATEVAADNEPKAETPKVATVEPTVEAKTEDKTEAKAETPVTEEVQKTDVDTEVKTETQAEPKEEAKVEVVETTKVETAPVMTLDLPIESSGLVQIETKTKAQPSDYVDHTPRGRKPVRYEADQTNEPLVQIETRKAPKVKEAAKPAEAETPAEDPLKTASHMVDVALYITEQLEKTERRPRRTRRGKKNEPAVKTHMKPIAEAVAGIVYEPTPLERLAAMAAKEEQRRQKVAKEAEAKAESLAEKPAEVVATPVETKVEPALEPVVETVVETVAETLVEETPVVAEVTTDVTAEVTPATKPVFTADVAQGLDENLERAGLVQVHTKPELVTFKGYEVVRYSGRPTPVRTDADEALHLEQVHTRPELCKPVVYEAVRYPGRPYTAPEAIAEEPLIQVHTRA